MRVSSPTTPRHSGSKRSKPLMAIMTLTALLTLMYLAFSGPKKNENDDSTLDYTAVGLQRKQEAIAAALSASSPLPLEILSEVERYMSEDFVSAGIYMDFSLKDIAESVSQLGGGALQGFLDRRGSISKVLVEVEPAPSMGVNLSHGLGVLSEAIEYSIFLPPLQRAAFRRLAAHHEHKPSSQYLSGIAKSGHIYIPRRLPTNLELLHVVCDLIPLVSNETAECSPASHNLMKLLTQLATIREQHRDKPLSRPEVERIRSLASKSDIVLDRLRLSSAGFGQLSAAVYRNGAHPFVSVVGTGQFLCSSSKNKGGGLSSANAKHTQMLNTFDKSLLAVHGPELLDLVQHQLTPLDASPRAEELLLSKLRIWDPLRAAHLSNRGVSPRDAARLVMRPTVLCAILTYEGPEGLDLALLQRSLWGHECDDHIIFIASSSKGGDGGARTRQQPGGGADSSKKPQGTMPIISERRRLAAAAKDFENIIYLPIPDHVQKKKPDGTSYPNMWQLFREVVSWLEMSTRTDAFSYIYFGFEDNYVIPQNLYLMLLQKDLYMLNALSTPLLLGHRMVSERNDGLPYASAGPGFIMNAVAIKVLQSLMPLPGCFPNNASNAVDLLLASCLGLAGIEARDASDLAGQDRMHVLSLHWLLQAPIFASGGVKSTAARESSGTINSSIVGHESPLSSSWWYLSHHQRSLQEQRMNPFASLSTTSFSFNKVNTPSKALWLHLQLFPPPLQQQQQG